MTSRTVIALCILFAPMSPALAQPTTINYTMTLAGLPVGSATMVLTPEGTRTSVAISGKAGGPFEIGRMNASAVIAADQVTAQSQSGSGKNASSATLVSRGKPGNSSFTYTGQSNRGPGKIAMTLADNRVTALDKQIPDNPNAVRVPVTDAHKTGVVDPLSLLAQLIKPGGTWQPENLCGRSHGIFTGQSRFTMTGTALESGVAKGLPEGYQAMACKVTLTPISGHRIDKGNTGKPSTAALVFARAPGGQTLLWSLSIPAVFGSFALTAKGLD